MYRIPIIAFALALVGSGCGLFGGKDKPADEVLPEELEAAPEPEPAEPAYDGPMLGIESLEDTGSNEAFLAFKEGRVELDKARGNKKKLASATAKLEQALQLDPGLPGVRYVLARAYARQEETARAADTLIEAMEICLPCTTGMTEHPDLVPLQDTEQWQEVQEQHSKYTDAWKQALASNGTFVLVGFGRMVRDKVWDGTDPDRSDRGRVYFYHEASEMFLPLGLGRDIAGFMVDPKGLHALSWGGWTAGSSSLPPRWFGMSVWSLDLTTMTTHRTKLPGEIMSAGVWVQDEKTHVTFLKLDVTGEQEGVEHWFTATCEDTKLANLVKTEQDGTPSSIDPAGSAKNKDVCIKRLDKTIDAPRYLLIDSFCGDHHPHAEAEPGPLPPIEKLLQGWPVAAS